MNRPPITLTLTYSSDGVLNITGPTHERVFCLGLLELAKDVLNLHHNTSTSRIVAPNPADLKVIK